MAASVKFGRLGKAGFVLAMLALLLFLRADSLFLTPGKANVAPHLFSFIEYELSNAPDKWAHRLSELWPGGERSREERLALLDEYLVTVRRAHKEEERIEGLLNAGGGVIGAGSGKGPAVSTEYLDELSAHRDRLRPVAEETLEAELSAALLELGFGLPMGLIWPPVDVRLDSPPALLVTSPRDEMRLLGATALEPGLRAFERDELEREIEAEHGVSALIVNLAGIGTYPALVRDDNTLRSVAIIAVHEWLHNHWFFRPLGWNYAASADMTTLNETAADLAGREIGDMAFARMGGDLSESPSRYLRGEANPQFTAFMRETRLHAEDLLSEGRVEEAERYMRERRWRLRLGGYGIRKLNQAYFAFHGQYAESAGSVSPIGAEVRELRELLPDVGAFSRAVSGVSSYAEFLELLERLRGDGGG